MHPKHFSWPLFVVLLLLQGCLLYTPQNQEGQHEDSVCANHNEATPFCRHGDLYQCVLGKTHLELEMVERCERGCMTATDGDSCAIDSICEDYADECEPGDQTTSSFCHQGDVYTCAVACDPNCGCWGRLEQVSQCQQGCEETAGEATCQDHNCPQSVLGCINENGPFCDADNNVAECVTICPDNNCPCYQELQVTSTCSDECHDMGEGFAYCCDTSTYVNECPDGVESGELFCSGNEIRLCQDQCDMCSCHFRATVVETCAETCQDSGVTATCISDDPCRGWTDECADLPVSADGSVCVDDDLYTCLMACDETCGCSGRLELIQHCDSTCHTGSSQSLCTSPSP